MLDKELFQKTPMGIALTELSEQMQKEKIPPVSINVIGGFALMMREIRNPNDTTDIDYVGNTLSPEFNALADKIGMKYKLGKGWINNDVMLSGSTFEDFEFATGKLHFEPAFSVGNININVLEEQDLLRMKLISIDTSLTAIDMGGEFTRMKDLPDIETMMKHANIKATDIEDKFGDYLISGMVPKVMETYNKEGIDGVNKIIKKQMDAYFERTKPKQEEYKRSSFIQNLLDSMYKRAEAEEKLFGDVDDPFSL